MRKFIYKDEKSSKFWNIEIKGNICSVTYGKIGTNGQTQTKEFDDEDSCTKEALKLISEKLKKGYIEGSGSSDEKQTKQTPREKVSNIINISKPVLEWYLKKHPKEHDLTDFENIVGYPAPPDLKHFGYPELDGDMFLPPFSKLAAVKGNLFEYILEKNDPYLDLRLRQLFTNCYFLTSIENPSDGDCFAVHITSKEGKNAQVSRWDHEENYFDSPAALDIPSALYFMDAYDKYFDNQNTKAFIKQLKNISENVNFNDLPFSVAFEDGEPLLEDFLEEHNFDTSKFSNVDRFSNRAQWIIDIFAFGKFEFSNWVPSDILDVGNTSKVLNDPILPHYLPSGLFWLWKSYFLNHKETLATLLQLFEKSRSRILRDTATLVQEFENGRKEIGAIKNIQELRDKVVAEITVGIAAREKADEASKKAEDEAKLKKLTEALRAPSGIYMSPVEKTITLPKAEVERECSLSNGDKLMVNDKGLIYTSKVGDAQKIIEWPLDKKKQPIIWWSLHPDEDRILAPVLPKGRDHCDINTSDGKIHPLLVEIDLHSGKQTIVADQILTACYLPSGRVFAHQNKGSVPCIMLFEKTEDNGPVQWNLIRKEYEYSISNFLPVLSNGIIPSWCKKSYGETTVILWFFHENYFNKLAEFETDGQFQGAVVENGTLYVLTSAGVMEVKEIEEAMQRNIQAYETARDVALEKAKASPNELVAVPQRNCPPKPESAELKGNGGTILIKSYQQWYHSIEYVSDNGNKRKIDIGSNIILLGVSMAPDKNSILLTTKKQIFHVSFGNGESRLVLDTRPLLKTFKKAGTTELEINAIEYLADGIAWVLLEHYLLGAESKKLLYTIRIETGEQIPGIPTPAIGYIYSLKNGRMPVYQVYENAEQYVFWRLESGKQNWLGTLPIEIGDVYEIDGHVYGTLDYEVLNLDTAVSLKNIHYELRQ